MKTSTHPAETHPAETPPFLTPAELAARWKITPMTLRRWRGMGRIKALHLGRGIRFSRSEIERIETESKA